MNRTVVVGAGPAGLSAGHELVRRGCRPLVLESGGTIGGIARTECYRGYRFDIGPHRFFTKSSDVKHRWREILGGDLHSTPRLSRIFYDEKYYAYPLQIGNAMRNMGLVESAAACLSYLRAGLGPKHGAETFEEWVSRRFGRRLYDRFFAAYTEKVWGRPGSEIGAEWAAQRIQDLSLSKAVANALFGAGRSRSLISSFAYPRLGSGMMWQAFSDVVAYGGGRVEVNAEVERIRHCNGSVVSVMVGGEEIGLGQLISSMPIAHLVNRFEPAAPDEILIAASQLHHRSLVSVCLILDQDHLFPDHWIYIHCPGVRVARITNFTNWSPNLISEPGTSSLGMEYFCDVGDETWSLPDTELVRLAATEIGSLGLVESDSLIDGMVIRQPLAYPLYDENFRENLAILQRYLTGYSNLQTIGRNGMHRYNNMDHSMLTGIHAVGNLFGEDVNLWSVNTEESYHEAGSSP